MFIYFTFYHIKNIAILKIVMNLFMMNHLISRFSHTHVQLHTTHTYITYIISRYHIGWQIKAWRMTLVPVHLVSALILIPHHIVTGQATLLVCVCIDVCAESPPGSSSILLWFFLISLPTSFLQLTACSLPKSWQVTMPSQKKKSSF